MSDKIKITLDQAKTICPDFNLVTRRDLDGAKACMSIMNDRELCTLGNHFVCELVLYKRGAARIEERASGTALTPASIGAINDCARKYHLEREKKLGSPAGETTWARAARAFSTARARIDQGLPFNVNDIDRKLLPAVDMARLRAALRFYADHPPYAVGSVSCNATCQFRFEGTWYQGFADAQSVDGAVIVEWRYAAKAYNALALAREAAVYFHGFPDAASYVRWRMRKSTHRPGRKGETMAAFEQRIYDAFVKDGTDKVYSRTLIERHQLDVEGVLREMRETNDKMLHAMREAGYPPSYGSCEMCDYQTLCGEMIGVPTELIVRHLELKKGS